jgi:hypothetical protein
MQAFITGEPGNAPAWYLNTQSAAVIRPSRFIPIFTVIDAPDVGPEALKHSSRLITTFTGQPDLRASMVATGST